MKSTMIFLGLFLVGATALRLEQKNCNLPRALNMSCHINDTCDVTYMDLQIKSDNILTFTKVTTEGKDVIKKFDQCLKNFVEGRVKEEKKESGIMFFYPHIARGNAYASVKGLDEAVHKQLAALAGVTERLENISRKTRNATITTRSDCFSNKSKFDACKTIQQDYYALLQGQAQLKNYRVAHMDNVSTATLSQLKNTDTVINEWEQLLQFLKFVDPTQTCDDRDCYKLVVAGSEWPQDQEGRIHGLWYQKEDEHPKYDPNYQYKITDYVNDPTYAGNMHYWANNGRGLMMSAEYMRHGRYQNWGLYPSAYWQAAERLLDHVHNIRQKTGSQLSSMTGKWRTDTVYCFNKKSSVGGVGMVLVKCA